MVDSHHHGGGGEIDGDEGSWSWLWVLFWLVVLLLCCAGCIYCLHWREDIIKKASVAKTLIP